MSPAIFIRKCHNYVYPSDIMNIAIALFVSVMSPALEIDCPDIHTWLLMFKDSMLSRKQFARNCLCRKYVLTVESALLLFIYEDSFLLFKCLYYRRHPCLPG